MKQGIGGKELHNQGDIAFMRRCPPPRPGWVLFFIARFDNEAAADYPHS